MSDGRYFASLLLDDGVEKPESISQGKAVGIDLGLIDFAVTSDGSKFNNPKHLKKHERNLKRKQRKLSRKKDKRPTSGVKPSLHWQEYIARFPE
ncbi:transposase [Leptolyngbya sp. AN03gr2]|uniref:transposase n=1 Tax=unclassified Leptolyngbya TaxID=2650499 RepID=UPI003D310818